MNLKEDAEPFDFKVEFDRIMLMVPIAAMVNTAEIHNTIERAHAIGPILDPTAYRKGMGNLEEQAELLGAFKPFAAAARKLMAKAEADGRVPA